VPVTIGVLTTIGRLTTLTRRAAWLPLGVAAGTLHHVTGLVQRVGRPAADEVRAPAADIHPAEEAVEIAVDEFGAVGSLNDNTGVEPDGSKPPFPGYDKLSGDSLMRHVAESTDLPDLQVLLSYEEAHKNRKGVISAVVARLAVLGTPVS
jgi:hypothetical protein